MAINVFVIFAMGFLSCFGYARPLTDSVNVNIQGTSGTYKKRVGISMLNYADSDERRDSGYKPIAEVVKTMSPGFLRFPGGLEASSYLWATAPSWSPVSHTPAFKTKSRWPNSEQSVVKHNEFVDVMNFDEFMEIANDVGADVTIVVNFDSMYTEDGPSKETLLETARQWVRYCKKNNFTNVKYWELGNESDMKSTYNGRPDNGVIYGRDAIDFATAMREEDDTILIGINGFHEEFMLDSLNTAGEFIDFFVLHLFPIWKFTNGYDDYVNGEGYYEKKYNEFTNALQMSSISQIKKDSIFIMITETSSVDWNDVNYDDGWEGNDVGHGLAMFDIIGKYMQYDRIRGILGWGSHWVHEHTDRTEICDILSNTNELNAVGYGIIPWTYAGDSRLLGATSDSSSIVVYALANSNGIMVMLMNKMRYSVSVNINVPWGKVVNAHSYYGETDTSKTFKTKGLPNELPGKLLPLSITMIQIN